MDCDTELLWRKYRSFSYSEAASSLAECRRHRVAHVAAVARVTRHVSAPLALDTVQLLKAASTGLGLSPRRAMEIAEELYCAGFISYPRTESTAYPRSMELLGLVQEQTRGPCAHAVSFEWLRPCGHRN